MPPRRTGLRTDTVAQSVMVLLIMAALQRMIGFVRGVLVCRWLTPDELGHWDMAFGFLTLAAPLTVLGLPGSFGRYVEYFRQRGQLRTLVRRTAIACVILTVLSVCAISLLRTQFSLFVFGETEETQLVLVDGAGAGGCHRLQLSDRIAQCFAAGTRERHRAVLQQPGVRRL